MKTTVICSLFVLSALVVGMVATPPIAFADHAEVTITPVPKQDGGEPRCDETPEGCFTPLTATVDVGGEVIFSNTGDEKHLFISGILIAETGEFTSGVVEPGSSFEWTPTEAGEVTYFCGIHPWEMGTIIVEDASTSMDGEIDDKEHADDKMMMKGDPSVTGMLSDGTMVKIWADAPTEGEMMEIFIKFANYGSMEDEMMDDTMMEDKDEMMDDTMMEDKDEMMDDTMMEDKDEMMDDTMMEDKDEMMDDTMMEDKDEMMDDGHMMDGDKMMSGGVEHVNYDIVVTQNGVNVLDDLGAHSHDGKYTHTTAALASADPVEITVTFNGFGLPGAEEFTGPVGEGVTFMNVVPEFGTIAMMVLAVAIVSIVAVTAKSRVVPRL